MVEHMVVSIYMQVAHPTDGTEYLIFDLVFLVILSLIRIPQPYTPKLLGLVSTEHSTVKFLNFRTPENFAVINIKFKQRGQTVENFAKKTLME